MKGNRGFPAATGMSYYDIEVSARKASHELIGGLCAGSPFPAQDVFEGLSDQLLNGRLCRPAVQELPEGVEAMTSLDTNGEDVTLVLSTSTYSSLEGNCPRARFTVAHELGHLFLHVKVLREIINLKSIGLRREKSRAWPIYMDTEWQADAFAAALLMPFEGVQEEEGRSEYGLYLDPEPLITRFGVSYTAAHIRAKNFRDRRPQLLVAAAVANPTI